MVASRPYPTVVAKMVIKSLLLRLESVYITLLSSYFLKESFAKLNMFKTQWQPWKNQYASYSHVRLTLMRNKSMHTLFGFLWNYFRENQEWLNIVNIFGVAFRWVSIISASMQKTRKFTQLSPNSGNVLSKRTLHASRNSVVFYWKFMNLLGSPTVFHSLIEHNRALVALKRKNHLSFLAVKYKEL